jgi:hypothetical protein
MVPLGAQYCMSAGGWQSPKGPWESAKISRRDQNSVRLTIAVTQKSVFPPLNRASQTPVTSGSGRYADKGHKQDQRYHGGWIVLAGWVLASVALAGPDAAPDAGTAPEDVFKSKGLTKVGFFLETATETEIHAAAPSVRGLKSRIGSESATRAGMSRVVDSATGALVKLQNDLAALDEQMQ